MRITRIKRHDAWMVVWDEMISAKFLWMKRIDSGTFDDASLIMSTDDHDALLEAMAAVTLTDDVPNGTLKHNDEEMSTEEMHAELEKMFLTPNQQFSDDWLNKLQQYFLLRIG